MALDYDKDYVVDLVKGIREAEYLCDVTLVAGMDGRRFPVHRNVMVASSPYFKALLGPNYREANLKEIPLSAFNGEMLQTIVNYCYSGSIPINNENVDDIMAAASSVELVQLEQKCANFWKERLSVENCLKVQSFADRYNLTVLRNKAFRFICDNFENIPAAAMVELDEKTFIEILKEDKIAADESNIFDRLVQWVEHDASNRSQLVFSLAKSIRLEHLQTEFLSERVETFYETHGCGELITNEKNKRKQNRKTIRPHRYQPGLYLADVAKSGKITILEYDHEDWRDFKTIPAQRLRENRIFSAGKAYLFDDGNQSARGMDTYDLITSEKEIVPDLPLNPILGAPISIGKHIYILGKHHQTQENVPFTSCYRFDRERKLWEVREPLPYRMEDLSVVELDGLIYVAGKIKRTESYASNFWCYDPNRNAWTAKAHTNFNKKGIILVKIKQSVCVCNTEVGFIRYDMVLNRWNKIDFHQPHLHKRKTANYDYELYDAVDSRGQSYGIMSTDEGSLFVEIYLSEKRCYFGDPHLCFLYQFLDISGGRMGLFVN